MTARGSTWRASEPIRVLRDCQWRDPDKGPFYAQVEATTKKHMGRVVYKDGTGQRFVIL